MKDKNVRTLKKIKTKERRAEMKKSVKWAAIIALGLIFFFPLISFSSSGGLIKGNEIGEIYFTGPTLSYYGASGIYHSTNNGQQITLQFSDSTDDFIGSLLSDVCDSCLYLLKTGDEQSLRLSKNDGSSWAMVASQVFGNGSVYGSGIVAGEIYRPINELANGIERSTNYGYSFTPCTAIGFPDTSWIYSLALGSIAGEVYLLTCWNDYYYSADSGESFTYLGNLWQAGAPNYSYLVSGSQMDEMFLFHYDSQRIWRITEQGQTLELFADFELGGWSVWVTAGNLPGQFYLRANYFDFGSYGGRTRIYLTENYGASWTMTEYLISPNGVINPEPALPENQDLAVWPNPTNASLSVGFYLTQPASVTIEVFDLTGRLVLTKKPLTNFVGYQSAQLDLTTLTSGAYFLRLTGKFQTPLAKFCLVK